MKNSSIEKFFWKIAEKLVHFLAGEVEKLALLWHGGSPSWITGTPLARWHVYLYVGALKSKVGTLLTRGHGDQACTHGRNATRFCKLIYVSTIRNPQLPNTCVFLYLSRIIGGHFCIPRETMELFFDLNIQKHQNGIDTMIFRIQRFECVNKVWTFIFFGFPHGRNLSVGLLWLRIDVIAVRKTAITTAIRTAFVIFLFVFRSFI